jgi:hypothetical protein
MLCSFASMPDLWFIVYVPPFDYFCKNSFSDQLKEKPPYDF